MGREEEIKHMHCGEVTRNDGRRVWVRITKPTASECSGCALEGTCGESASTAEEIEVPVNLPQGAATPAMGSTVRVRADGLPKARVATILIGVPLTSFVGGIMAVSLAGGSELWSLLAGLALGALSFVGVRTIGKSVIVWTLAE